MRDGDANKLVKPVVGANAGNLGATAVCFKQLPARGVGKSVVTKPLSSKPYL